MNAINNIKIFETTLCPSFVNESIREKFIAAILYQEFLQQELEKVSLEIKDLSKLIEIKISKAI